MSLTLHCHPFAAFCQKVLIALYENGTPFRPHLVDLGDAASRAQFLTLWPIGKMPVLRDEAHDRTVPESSAIIEYLGRHYPGPVRLIPADADLALQVRLQDRFFDLYVAEPMQKIVIDRLRPPGMGDPYGVAAARAALHTAYAMLDQSMAGAGLGRRRYLHDGRLRRRTGIVLRRLGRAVGQEPPQPGRLSSPADATPVLRPRDRGGPALSPPLPAGSGSRLSSGGPTDAGSRRHLTDQPGCHPTQRSQQALRGRHSGDGGHDAGETHRGAESRRQLPMILCGRLAAEHGGGGESR